MSYRLNVRTQSGSLASHILISKFAATILTVAIVSIALNPANAEVAGKTTPTQSRFECPPHVSGATSRQREAIRGKKTQTSY
jgi:hypothetical protein